MKKLFLFVTIIALFAGLAFSANAIQELPEDGVAYVVVCDTCHKKTAYDTLPGYISRGCFNSDCNGTIDFTNYTYCAKEYYYSFNCGNNECNISNEYDELPEGTADAPYGICTCGTKRTEDMFQIDFHYKQYSRPCFYCYKVQIGTPNVYDSDFCPHCGELYYDAYEPPASVDENGQLIFGGGGNYLYYCSETNKFYEAEKPVDDEEIHSDCPYCDNHKQLKINVIYSAKCPDCGTRAEYEYLEYFKKPIPLSTFNNALAMIFLDITNGSINPSDFDLSINCLECGYSFLDDKNIVINRHVDAPKSAVYEKHSNDLPYKKTDKYKTEGSEYDNIFEEIIWRINYAINYIKDHSLLLQLLSGNISLDSTQSINEYVSTINFSEYPQNKAELISTID